MLKSILLTLGQLVFTLLMYSLGIFYFGLALVPGVALFFKVWGLVQGLSPIYQFIAVGFSISAAFFLFGLSLVLLGGLTIMVFRLKLKEGKYPIFSWMALQWAFISSLYQMINFTFSNFLLCTPFMNLLLRMMGAKLGRNVQINSPHVYDASLVEIGDNTVIGGGAIIDAHMVERGFLKLKKVIIGKNVTIGSHSTIMPGCEIADGAIIGASAVLLKNTKVETRAIYFGVPAEPLRPKHHKEETNNAPSQS